MRKNLLLSSVAILGACACRSTFSDTFYLKAKMVSLSTSYKISSNIDVPFWVQQKSSCFNKKHNIKPRSAFA